MSKGKRTSIGEIAPPPGAYGGAGAFEILRAWVVNGGLQVSMKKVWDEPDPWGVLLVDLARHASRAYAAEKVCSFEEAMAKIRALLEAEWARPTDMGTTTPHQKQ